MKHYRALDKIMLLVMLSLSIFCCKQKENNLTQQIVNKKQAFQDNEDLIKCELDKKNLSGYEKKIRYIYENNPSKLDIELIEKAKEFSEIIKSLLKNNYNSEFNVVIEYSVNESECYGNILFITNDTINIEGEIQNIESSLILKIKEKDNKLKIFDIVTAG